MPFVFGCAVSLFPTHGLSLVVPSGLLSAVASLVEESGSRAGGLGSYGAKVQLPCGMWSLPRSGGMEPTSLALAVDS